jgi:hypothetical protein
VFDFGFVGGLTHVASVANGQIRIGDFSERFEVDLSYWTMKRYVESWARAIDVLEMQEVSCLVASITDPSSSNFCFCWSLYRSCNDVFVQQIVIFFDMLTRPFDPDAPWESIPPRVTVNEEGDRISEWKVTTAAISDFRRRLDVDPT